ncbi:MAG: phytoene/squalene synthase family protein, partial [Verrucomicrobiales bacterium]
ALESAAELDEYTYLVAGCVGEFWTEVGFLELGDRYAVRPVGEMLELGKRYGQALQLINILRDLPEDLEAGRCYLPLDEIGSTEAAAPVLMAESEKWLARCREHFDCGAEYVAAVKNRRMRLAAGLPLLIGARTLPLLAAADWRELSNGVKISRSEVKSVMWRALLANRSRRAMARHCAEALADS